MLFCPILIWLGMWTGFYLILADSEVPDVAHETKIKLILNKKIWRKTNLAMLSQN